MPPSFRPAAKSPASQIEPAALGFNLSFLRSIAPGQGAAGFGRRKGGSAASGCFCRGKAPAKTIENQFVNSLK